MRLWHIDLLPYLPELQFKGQLRELVAILHDWRDKGKTNHILINIVMEYPKSDFAKYFLEYSKEYKKRYGQEISAKTRIEFEEFCGEPTQNKPFYGWHDKEYFMICVSNLKEKYIYGRGKTRLTKEDWNKIEKGAKEYEKIQID